MYEDVLAEIGLSKWEAKTYLALLEIGSTTTGPLVKKCEVPQSKIYSVLESLNKKGLVSFVIKGKIKYFQASSPEVVLSIIKDKERKVAESITGLKQLALASKNKQSVEIYEGMKAITSFFVSLIEQAKKGDGWMGFSIGEDDFFGKVKEFWYKIGLLRAEQGLNVKIMNNIKYKKNYQEDFKDRWKYIKLIIRFSGDIFPATTVIFNNKIILLNFMSEPETAVVINSKDLFNFYKSFYLQEWGKAKKA